MADGCGEAGQERGFLSGGGLRAERNLPRILNDHLAGLALRPAFVGQREADCGPLPGDQHQWVGDGPVNEFEEAGWFRAGAQFKREDRDLQILAYPVVKRGHRSQR